MRGIVLDFDGPIFDGREVRKKAFTSFWEEEFSKDELPEIGGLKLMKSELFLKTVLLQNNFAEKYTDNMLTKFREKLKSFEYKSDINQELKKVLRDVHKNPNIKMAIYTNRNQKSIEGLTKCLGIFKYFDDIYSRDSFEPKPSTKAFTDFMTKHGLRQNEITFIGDSDEDYNSTRNENLNISYYHAAYTGEPSNQAWVKCNYVIHQVDELCQLIKSASRVIDEIITIHSIPEKLRNSIEKKDIVFYTGAGISINSGFKNWFSAYRDIFSAQNILHLFDKNDIISSLQLAFEDRVNYNALFDEFKNEFNKFYEPNVYHYSILNASHSKIWTTNYDQMFEFAISKFKLNREMIRTDRELLSNINKSNLIVKMNGDFNVASHNGEGTSNIVLTQEHFDLYEKNRGEIWRAFEDDYRKRSIVFVGTSLNDPVLKRLLSTAKSKLQKPVKTHYLLLKKNNDLIQSQIQQLQKSSLKKYSIEALYFDTFDDIIEFTKKIAVLNIQPIVGFSGTIDINETMESYYFDSLFTKRETEEVCAKLGKNLVNTGYRVTSGCGASVGKPAVESAFKENNNFARYYLRLGGGSDYIGNAPAVVVPNYDNRTQNRYQRMRETFINELHILLVFSGRVHSQKSTNSGIVEEIDLACKNSVPVFVFKQFGGYTLKHYDEIIERLKKGYEDQEIKKMVVDINKRISNMNREDLIDYLDNDFLSEIDETVQFLAGKCKIDKRSRTYNNW